MKRKMGVEVYKHEVRRPPVYKQVVSASFDVSGLGMPVTVQNLPFDWDYRHGPKDEVGAGEAAKWLFENAPECHAKCLTLRWVTVSPAKEVEELQNGYQSA